MPSVLRTPLNAHGICRHTQRSPVLPYKDGFYFSITLPMKKCHYTIFFVCFASVENNLCYYEKKNKLHIQQMLYLRA